jgi:phosphoribosylamine--glycine ligase
MNIAILSSTSSYHHLAQMLAKESTVYHYGANSSVLPSTNYIPIHSEMPADRALSDSEVFAFLENIKSKNIDFALASGLPIPADNRIHRGLKNLHIPYFFANREVIALEYNKFTCKKMLNKLGIPTGVGEQVTGLYLFENFKSIPRPFVVKLYPYQYGKQTVIVTDDNHEEVFLDLFSKKLGKESRISNINDDFGLVIEQFINIKLELSYHLLINETGWTYFGSARDYKRLEDGDLGPNSVSMGAYNVSDVDPRIHDYADRIVNFLKEQGYYYKGFMFLGIAIDKTDTPIILEINTRSGDPELPSMLGSITNNLSELFLAASTNMPFPPVVHNNNKTVTLRLINSVYDWTVPGVDLPILDTVPSNIVHGIEGTPEFFIKHSLFTASDNTYKAASEQIYNYLNSQYVGQYRYRKDIGLLK